MVDVEYYSHRQAMLTAVWVLALEILFILLVLVFSI